MSPAASDIFSAAPTIPSTGASASASSVDRAAMSRLIRARSWRTSICSSSSSTSAATSSLPGRTAEYDRSISSSAVSFISASTALTLTGS